MGVDAAVMPHIDQANIACGFHAGDPLVMQQTLSLAKTHGVSVGAHPSYPDIVGFGRRAMNCSTAEIHALLNYQIAALDGMALNQGLQLHYVKPHGALYNDMMSTHQIRNAVMNAVAAYHKPLKLMLQATPSAKDHLAEAEKFGLTLLFEVFADRRYDDNGLLLSRTKTGAVLDKRQILAQVTQLLRHSSVTTVSGLNLPLTADSLCVHGDNEDSVALISEIRQLIHQLTSPSQHLSPQHPLPKHP